MSPGLSQQDGATQVCWGLRGTDRSAWVFLGLSWERGRERGMFFVVSKAALTRLLKSF